MKGFLAALRGLFAGFGVGFLLIAIAYGVSWIATCGVIYLITLIFGWSFNWLIATGIWLALCLARGVFRGNN